MHGELLHAVTEIEQAEVPGTDVAAARPEKQLAASLEHVDADVVDEWARHLARPAHADVVAGVRAGTAGSVRQQQVVPAVAKDHDRRFAVDGDVDRLRRGLRRCPVFGFELDESNVAEVRPVGEPERAVGRITKHARVDGIAVLHAIGPDHRTGVLPLVVGRIRIERPADEQSDRRLRLRPRGRVIDEVLVARSNHVRRPGVVAAARDHLRAGASAGERLHQRAGAPPRPSIVGDGNRQAAAGAIGVELAVVQDDRRRVVHAGIAVERQQRRYEDERCHRSSDRFHRSTVGVDAPPDTRGADVVTSAARLCVSLRGIC